MYCRSRLRSGALSSGLDGCDAAGAGCDGAACGADADAFDSLYSPVARGVPSRRVPSPARGGGGVPPRSVL